MNRFNFIQNNRNWQIFAITVLLGAIALRIAFLIVMVPRMEGTDFDSDKYLRAAEQLREGTWVDVRRPPVYVFVCAICQVLPGSEMLWTQLFNIAFDVGVIALLLGWGPRLGGRIPALAAGMLYAVYPLAIWRMPLVGSDTMHVFYMTALLWGLGRLKPSGEGSHWTTWILAGFFFGILILLKQLYKFMPALLVFYWLVKYRKEFAAISKRVTVWLVIVILTVAPWTYRNYRVSGEFIPVAAGLSGLAMFIGNHVPGQGRWEGDAKAKWEEALDDVQAANPEISRHNNPKEYDAFLTTAAIQHIRENFAAWLPLLPKKALRFWFIPASETKIFLSIVVQLFYLLCAAYGAYRRPDLLRNLVLPGLMLLYTWGLYTLSYSCIRFSLVAIPWLCLMAGWIVAIPKSGAKPLAEDKAAF